MLIMGSENAGVDHLVVDACGFINNAQLQSLGKHLYTVPEVINELRDKAVRERIRNLPYEVMLKEPSSEALKTVTEASKKSGDYIALSATDLKVLALTYQLHVQHYGKDTVNLDIKPTLIVDQQKVKKDAQTIFGFHKESVTENEEEEHDTDASDNEDWVGEENFAEAVAAGDLAEDKQEVEAVDSKEIKVACLTTDFSIQNLLLHMKIKICSADGLVIKRLNSYILRCRSCYSTTAIMTKEFCPKCGHKTLHRVAVSVDESGTQHLHIDFEKLRVTRGMKHSVAAPKGGKHGNMEQIFEDQKVAHNRMARGAAENFLDTSPFSLNDVTSRGALLGLRSYDFNRRNPNENTRSRRKGKK